MAHLHITSWVLAFILLIVVTMFYKQGKTKPGKILHMILRLDYLLILYSGGSLFGLYDSMSLALIIKVIAGIWAIVAMEMVSVRTSKNRPINSWGIQLVIVALIAIGLGFFHLPFGILP
ncbi:MAG TPA: YisL family protein [Virgibacillus sp.]|nr:YisL family protein [Virgibacillus sp.]